MDYIKSKSCKIKTTKPLIKVVLGWSFSKRKTFLAAIIMVLLLIPGFQAESDGGSVFDPIIDPLQNAVSGGITSFIISMCDGIFYYFSSGTPDDINFSDPVTEKLYMIATYSINPFDLEIVKTTAQTSAVFWFIGMLLFFGYGLLMLVISKYSRTISNSIEFITKTTPVHSAQSYFRWSITGILLGLSFYILVALTLLFSNAMTSLFMVAALPAIQPTPDNVILYCIVAGLYLAMLLFFAMRSLYLCLYVSFGLIIIVLFIFSKITREMAIKLSIYFLSFAFLQPLVVALTTGGVLIIHEIGVFAVLLPNPMLYASLLVIILYFSMKLIFGTQRIRELISMTESTTEKIIKVVV